MTEDRRRKKGLECRKGKGIDIRGKGGDKMAWGIEKKKIKNQRKQEMESREDKVMQRRIRRRIIKK